MVSDTNGGRRRPTRATRSRRALLALALSVGLLGPAFTSPKAEAAIIERVVAVVGEQAILFSDLRERALPFLVRVYENVPEGPQRAAALNQVYTVVLQRMVEEELEDAAAARMGIVVTSQEIDDALGRIAGQNNLSRNALLAEAKRSGLSVAQYREELRRQVLQAKITNIRLQGRIRVTEADMKAAYKGYQVDERLKATQRTLRLVLPLGATPEQQASQLKKAEEIVRRAKAGEDFRALVEEFPPLPGSGLAKPLAPAEEPEAIRRASVVLDIGEVSAPIRTNNSLMILQVVERPPSDLPSYDDARDQLQQRVYMEKMAKARQNWLNSLKKRTHVEVKL
jgi:peptidyl-prolyl cis-trans isomerase SurA